MHADTLVLLVILVHIVLLKLIFDACMHRGSGERAVECIGKYSAQWILPFRLAQGNGLF